MISTSPSFFTLSMLPPTRSPIGVIDISAPRLKNTIPTITMKDPSKNSDNTAVDTGAILRHSIRTMSTIGITALTDSLVFSFSFSLKIRLW